MNLLEQKKLIEKVKSEKVKIEERLKMLHQQKEDQIKKCNELGVDINDLDNVIKNLEIKCQGHINELQSILQSVN